MKEKVLFGTISHERGLYCIYFKSNGSSYNHHLESCDSDVFKKYPKIPIIRFDLSGIDNVLAWLKGPVKKIIGYHYIYDDDNPYTLTEYLDRALLFNIPVDNYR